MTKVMQSANPTMPTGTAEQQKSQQKTMKIMNYVMPLMLGVFAIMYSSAFALYYFISNVMVAIINISFTLIYKQIEKAGGGYAFRRYRRKEEMKETEVTAATLEEAAEKAAEELGVTKDRIETEVIKTSGIIKKKPDRESDRKSHAAGARSGLHQRTYRKDEPQLHGDAVRRRGCLPHPAGQGYSRTHRLQRRRARLRTVSHPAYRQQKEALDKRVILDGENYREKRTVTLSKLAKISLSKRQRAADPSNWSL